MSADIKIEYTNVPTGAMEGSTTIASSKQSWVNLDDFKTQRQVPKYANLEINRNLLYPNTADMFQNTADAPTGYGYVSGSISNARGVLATTTLTRTYNQNFTSPRSYD